LSGSEWQAQAALPHFIIRFSTVPFTEVLELIEAPFEFMETLRAEFQPPLGR
jgi:hypothetical protein